MSGVSFPEIVEKVAAFVRTVPAVVAAGDKMEADWVVGVHGIVPRPPLNEGTTRAASDRAEGDAAASGSGKTA